MHELAVTLEVREGAEVGKLVDARIDRLRPRLTGALDRLEAAGRLLRWTRRASPTNVAEPEAFAVITDGLDALDAEGPVEPEAILARTGLDLLDALGWGLDLGRCVACGRQCPPGAAASVDPVRGGLVCRACGGARRVWSAALRARVLEGRQQGTFDPAATAAALELVEAVLDAHVAPPRSPQPPPSRDR